MSADRMSASSDLPAFGGHRIARVAFAWGFAAALIVALRRTEILLLDSGGYWSLGSTFFLNGHFSVLNFANPVRGYLLPLSIISWRFGARRSDGIHRSPLSSSMRSRSR